MSARREISASRCGELAKARHRTRFVTDHLDALARMTLLADLEEFARDHRPHGGLTGDATQPAWNGYRLTVARSCGVTFERWVTPEDADADLVSGRR